MGTTENIKVLDKALIILDVLREAKGPVGVNEISKICPVNQTTAFRILKTLKNHGFVYQDNQDKYIIGHKISFVTEKNNFYMALKEIAHYTMSKLSAAESQAMNLIVRENERCYILQQTRTEKIVDYVPPKGSAVPIYASAGGKVLMSELPENILNLILDKTELKPMTKHTITNRADLLNELTIIKKLGYAVDESESQDNGFCIAVPVRCNDGEIIAALSFSGFIGRIPDNRLEYYYQALQNASTEITKNLFKQIVWQKRPHK